MRKAAVIIPVHNDAFSIEVCLSAVKPSIELSGWELIVVDDASTDSSARIAERFGVKLIELKQNQGVAAARNVGARASSADILIFVDADIVPGSGVLEEMVKVLESRPDVHAVGAYPLPYDLSSKWSAHFVGLHSVWGCQWAEDETERPFSSMQSECGAIRKETFEELGGFKQYGGVGMDEYKMGHDMEYRGYTNLLIRKASYKHYYKTLRNRALSLIKRTARWVPLLLRRKRFESSGAIGTPGMAFSCALTFIALAALAAGVFVHSLWAAAILALFVQLIMEVKFLCFARKIYGWPMVFYSLPALQVLYLSIGAGFILGLIRLSYGKKS